MLKSSELKPFNINKYKIQKQNWKIIIYQSFTNNFYSVQPDSSTKYIARVKPSEYGTDEQ